MKPAHIHTDPCASEASRKYAKAMADAKARLQMLNLEEEQAELDMEAERRRKQAQIPSAVDSSDSDDSFLETKEADSEADDLDDSPSLSAAQPRRRTNKLEAERRRLLDTLQAREQEVARHQRTAEQTRQHLAEQKHASKVLSEARKATVDEQARIISELRSNCLAAKREAALLRAAEQGRSEEFDRVLASKRNAEARARRLTKALLASQEVGALVESDDAQFVRVGWVTSQLQTALFSLEEQRRGLVDVLTRNRGLLQTLDTAVQVGVCQEQQDDGVLPSPSSAALSSCVFAAREVVELDVTDVASLLAFDEDVQTAFEKVVGELDDRAVPLSQLSKPSMAASEGMSSEQAAATYAELEELQVQLQQSGVRLAAEQHARELQAQDLEAREAEVAALREQEREREGVLHQLEAQFEAQQVELGAFKGHADENAAARREAEAHVATLGQERDALAAALAGRERELQAEQEAAHLLAQELDSLRNLFTLSERNRDDTQQQTRAAMADLETAASARIKELVTLRHDFDEVKRERRSAVEAVEAAKARGEQMSAALADMQRAVQAEREEAARKVAALEAQLEAQRQEVAKQQQGAEAAREAASLREAALESQLEAQAGEMEAGRAAAAEKEKLQQRAHAEERLRTRVQAAKVAQRAVMRCWRQRALGQAWRQWDRHTASRRAEELSARSQDEVNELAAEKREVESALAHHKEQVLADKRWRLQVRVGSGRRRAMVKAFKAWATHSRRAKADKAAMATKLVKRLSSMRLRRAWRDWRGVTHSTAMKELWTAFEQNIKDQAVQGEAALAGEEAKRKAELAALLAQKEAQLDEQARLKQQQMETALQAKQAELDALAAQAKVVLDDLEARQRAAAQHKHSRASAMVQRRRRLAVSAAFRAWTAHVKARRAQKQAVASKLARKVSSIHLRLTWVQWRTHVAEQRSVAAHQTAEQERREREQQGSEAVAKLQVEKQVAVERLALQQQEAQTALRRAVEAGIRRRHKQAAARVFLQWARYTREQRDAKAAVMEKTVKRLATRQKQLAWQRWQRHVRDARVRDMRTQLQEQLQHTSRQSQDMSNALAAHKAEQAAVNKRRALAMIRQRQVVSASLMFARWVQYTRERRDAKTSVMKRTVRRLTDLQRRQAWNAWKGVTAAQRLEHVRRGYKTQLDGHVADATARHQASLASLSAEKEAAMDQARALVLRRACRGMRTGRVADAWRRWRHHVTTLREEEARSAVDAAERKGEEKLAEAQQAMQELSEASLASLSAEKLAGMHNARALALRRACRNMRAGCVADAWRRWRHHVTSEVREEEARFAFEAGVSAAERKAEEKLAEAERTGGERLAEEQEKLAEAEQAMQELSGARQAALASLAEQKLRLEDVRKQSVAALVRGHERRAVSRAFQVWAVSAKHRGGRRRQLVRRTADRCATRQLRAAWVAWRRHNLKGDQKQELERRLRRQALQGQSAEEALERVRQEHADQGMRRAMIMIRRWQKQTAAAAFARWVQFTRERKAHRAATLRKMSQRVARVHVQRAWRDWRRLLEEAAVAKMRQQLQTAQTQLLEQLESVEGRLMHQKGKYVDHALQRRRLRSKGDAFRAWREHTKAQRKHRHSVLDRACRRLVHGHMQRAWIRWREHVSESRVSELKKGFEMQLRRQAVQGEADLFAQTQALLQEVESQRQACVDQKRQRVHTSVQYRRRQALATAFTAWAGFARGRRATKVAVVKRLAHRATHSQLLQSWRAWRRVVVTRRVQDLERGLSEGAERLRQAQQAAAEERQGHGVAAITKQRHRRFMARAFTRWAKATRARTKDKALALRRGKALRRAGMRLGNLQMARAWRAWRDWVRMCRAEEQQLAFERALQSQVVQGREEAMQDLEAQRKALVMQRKQQAEAMIRRWQKQTAAAAFARWVQFTRERKAHRAATLRKMSQRVARVHVQRAWRHWRRLTEHATVAKMRQQLETAQSQLARARQLRMANTVQHWRLAAEARVFRAWRDRTAMRRQDRRGALDRACRRLQHGKLQRAWLRWRQYVSNERVRSMQQRFEERLESQGERGQAALEDLQQEKQAVLKALEEAHTAARLEEERQQAEAGTQGQEQERAEALQSALAAQREELLEDGRRRAMIMIRRWQKQTAAAAFARWVQFTRERKAHRAATLRKMSQRVARVHVQRAWRDWRRLLEEAAVAKMRQQLESERAALSQRLSRQKQQRAADMIQRWRLAAKARAFRTWLDHTRARKQQRAAAMMVLSRKLVLRRKLGAWRRWRACVEQSRVDQLQREFAETLQTQRARGVDAMRSRRQARTEAECFRGWRRRTKEARDRRAQALETCSRARGRAVVLRAWRLWRRGAEKARVAALQAQYEDKLASQARQHRESERLARQTRAEAARRKLQRAAEERVARVFGQWRDVARKRQQERQLLAERLASTVCKARVREVWRAWKRTSDHRRAFRRLGVRLTHAQLLRAWRQWRTHTEALRLREVQMQLHDAQAFLQRQVLSRQRASLAALTSRRRNRTLAQCLRGWRAYALGRGAKRRQLLGRAVGRMHDAALRRALGRWRGEAERRKHVELSREKETAEKEVKALAQQKETAELEAKQLARQKETAESEAKALRARSHKRSVRACFSQWRSLAEARKQRKAEVLRRCVRWMRLSLLWRGYGAWKKLVKNEEINEMQASLLSHSLDNEQLRKSLELADTQARSEQHSIQVLREHHEAVAAENAAMRGDLEDKSDLVEFLRREKAKIALVHQDTMNQLLRVEAEQQVGITGSLLGGDEWDGFNLAMSFDTHHTHSDLGATLGQSSSSSSSGVASSSPIAGSNVSRLLPQHLDGADDALGRAVSLSPAKAPLYSYSPTPQKHATRPQQDQLNALAASSSSHLGSMSAVPVPPPEPSSLDVTAEWPQSPALSRLGDGTPLVTPQALDGGGGRGRSRSRQTPAAAQLVQLARDGRQAMMEYDLLRTPSKGDGDREVQAKQQQSQQEQPAWGAPPSTHSFHRAGPDLHFITPVKLRRSGNASRQSWVQSPGLEHMLLGASGDAEGVDGDDTLLMTLNATDMRDDTMLHQLRYEEEAMNRELNSSLAELRVEELAAREDQLLNRTRGSIASGMRPLDRTRGSASLLHSTIHKTPRVSLYEGQATRLVRPQTTGRKDSGVGIGVASPVTHNIDELGRLEADLELDLSIALQDGA